MGKIGDLVTVLAGRGSPRIIAVHGSHRSVHAALAALVSDAGRGRDFAPGILDAADTAADRGTSDAGPREDLTHQRVITIDPEGAKDHDDAIAVARDGDGIRLWVHIADVSAYVPSGGNIDREAARRGNSLYVPGRVDPMLPPRLSNDICSLRPGEDRLAVTCEMTVAPDGEVRTARFCRSVIHSRRRLTYPEVDRLFDGGTLGDPALEADVHLAREVAERLRARRVARHGLEIATAEPVIQFDRDRVAGIVMESQTASHRLIEDCMIAANEAVARYMIDRGLPTVFRHHPDPAERSIRMLYDRMDTLGIANAGIPETPLAPSECAEAAVVAARDIEQHVARHGGRQGLPVLVLQSLRQAFYSTRDATHSGLASAAYLHFTSPIRRYPDLLVHRALLAALGIGPPSEDPDALALAAEHSSITERQAIGVERRADRMCRAFLTQEVISTDHDAIFAGEITGVGDSGMYVAFGPNHILEGYLPARAIDGDWWVPDPSGVMLIGEDDGRRFAVGDPVEVRVVNVEPLRGRVELEPAHGATPRPRHAPRRGARRRRF